MDGQSEGGWPSKEAERLEADDQGLLDSFVAQAAIALRNARLFEDLRVAHEQLAQSQAASRPVRAGKTLHAEQCAPGNRQGLDSDAVKSLLRWATTDQHQEEIRRGAHRSLDARAAFWSALAEQLFEDLSPTPTVG
jgi:hypothetical protein